MLITIIIRTYNRAAHIGRALESLKKQSVQQFECLIVDDGSTDNTAEIVAEFKKKAPFPVRYYYKENGGAHSALNEGIRRTQTPFFIQLDSDDFLSDRAVEIFLTTWNSLSKKEKKYYNGGIIGLVRNAATGEILEGKFPENINRMSKKKYCRYLNGTRIGMTSTKLCKKYLIEGAEKHSFMMESTIWVGTKIESRSYAINEVILYYDMDNMDSISNSKLSQTGCRNMFSSYLYIINHFYPAYTIPFIDQAVAYTFFVRFGLDIGEKYGKILKRLKRRRNRLFCLLLTPLSILFYLKDKQRLKEDQ